MKKLAIVMALVMSLTAFTGFAATDFTKSPLKAVAPVAVATTDVALNAESKEQLLKNGMAKEMLDILISAGLTEMLLDNLVQADLIDVIINGTITQDTLAQLVDLGLNEEKVNLIQVTTAPAPEETESDGTFIIENTKGGFATKFKNIEITNDIENTFARQGEVLASFALILDKTVELDGRYSVVSIPIEAETTESLISISAYALLQTGRAVRLPGSITYTNSTKTAGNIRLALPETFLVKADGMQVALLNIISGKNKLRTPENELPSLTPAAAVFGSSTITY